MPAQYYERTDQMATRAIAGQTILIPVSRRPESYQAVFLLNESSAALWQHLASPRDAAALAMHLSTTFDVGGADTDIAGDVAGFLTDMLAFGAIRALPG